MVQTVYRPDAVATHKKKTERLEFLADPDFVKTASKEAERMGLTLASYIRLAVIEKIDRDTAQRKSRQNKSGD